MKYETYLKNKNLSENTLKVYLRNYSIWKIWINNKNPNKRLVLNFIKKYSKNHKPSSIRLIFSSIISIFKFEKRWKLINECKDIRLPSQQYVPKSIITLEEFNLIKNIEFDTWLTKRNWLIFSFLFLTGIRINELRNIDSSKIKNNTIEIIGKGNKHRLIYIPDYLETLLINWNHKWITINKNEKILSIKQINLIIKRMGLTYFNKSITPHSLRRSYATNLSKQNVNIEIIKNILGHSNINTTTRYLQFNNEDAVNSIKKAFNNKG